MLVAVDCIRNQIVDAVQYTTKYWGLGHAPLKPFCVRTSDVTRHLQHYRHLHHNTYTTIDRSQRELTFSQFYQREVVISGVSVNFFNQIVDGVEVHIKVRRPGACYKWKN